MDSLLWITYIFQSGRPVIYIDSKKKQKVGRNKKNIEQTKLLLKVFKI